MKLPVAMTIAGSDSGGGAGIQADLKTFAALGVHGTSAITAITAQNTTGVTSILELPATLVREQMAVVVQDLGVQAAKTGMLSSAAIIAAVAEAISDLGIHNVVVDPVMVAKGGAKLLRDDAVAELRKRLVPLATVITPNLPEAEVLLGRKIASLDDRRAAAHELVALGANTHGSGCVFSAAITAGLARGLAPLAAVHEAKDFITLAIAHSLEIGHGHGPVNPMFALRTEG